MQSITLLLIIIIVTILIISDHAINYAYMEGYVIVHAIKTRLHATKCLDLTPSNGIHFLNYFAK